MKIFLPLFLLLATSVGAQQGTPTTTPTTPSTPAATNYDVLLERAKKLDETVDFKQLRLAYTETSKYHPYDGDRETSNNLFAALTAKDFEKALSQANKLLEANYLDINGHFGAFSAHRNLGHTEEAQFHRFMTAHLIHSIQASGDGKSTDTALVVISTDEEYVLFNFLDLQPKDQTLINEKGHSYDKMTALDRKTNETVVYYFNIDKPFGWLSKSLKN